MSENVLLWLGGQVVIAAAVWGAIRSDIKNMHERIARLETRFDQHFYRRSNDE